jgi:hypothetical protein
VIELMTAMPAAAVKLAIREVAMVPHSSQQLKTPVLIPHDSVAFTSDMLKFLAILDGRVAAHE